jgi:anthranilate synthase component 2
MNILLIDNHDSFTFNLVELLRTNGKVTFNVVRSDRLDTCNVWSYDKIMFSPGPGLPEEQPSMFRLLKELAGRKPILGICLGMQAIALFYGGSLYNLKKPVHGQPRKLIQVRPHYLFDSLPADVVVGLYHSWAVSGKDLPGCLEVLAHSEEGVVMALAHREFDVCGLQFHPESVITGPGQQMIDSWLAH